MSHQNLYQELSKKVGTENSQIVSEIWQTVCTPQEAALLNLLPATMEELIQGFGKPQEEVSSMLQTLFHKGVVFKMNKDGKTVYRLPKHIIQFHDATTLWAEAPSALIELWKRYTEEEYPQIPAAVTAMKISPFFRVIPINEKIEMKSQVLVYEDAAKILEAATAIAVTNCPCRMIMRKCDKPIDVCLQLNKGAEYAIERGTGRRIDTEEAKSILRRAEDAGLVHITENKAGIGLVICNCCSCCCVGLPYAKNVATKGMLVPSRYQAAIDSNVCTGCEACVDDCPMGAIKMSEENIATLDVEACIGCGICAHVCPTDAINLIVVRQEDFIPL